MVSAPINAEQPARLLRIGLFVPPAASIAEGLRQSLGDLGHVEGKTIVSEWRVADGTQEQLRSIAADLVRSKVELIIAWGSPAAHAVLDTTRTVPTVFCAGDPVATGMVASLAKPGGNATGVAQLLPELTAKRVELLRELLPRARRIGYLRNPSNPIAAGQFAEVQHIVRTLARRIELVAIDARDTGEVQTALRGLSQRKLHALIVSGDNLFLKERARIASTVRKAKLPTTFPTREDVQHGAVMSYGWSIKELTRRIAIYADKILKGAKPADLPVEQASKYELVINLSIARELEIDVPQALLLRADEVIQ